MAFRPMVLGTVAELTFGVVAIACQASSAALEPPILDPAFTFARPKSNHGAEITPPDLPVSAHIRPHPGARDLGDEPTLRGLFRSLVETFVPPRAIFWEGDAAGHVFHVLEGCFRLSRVLQDGRRAIVGFGHAGNLLGASFRNHHPLTAEAVTPVRLRRLPRHRFDALIDGSRDLRSQLLTEISSEMAAAQDHIIHLGRTAADQRVATFLLDIARRTGADMMAPVEIDIPFRRVDIADYMGLTVETISRVLSKLKRDGLISTMGPQKIFIRRLRALRDVARIDIDEPRGDTIVQCHTLRYSA